MGCVEDVPAPRLAAQTPPSSLGEGLSNAFLERGQQDEAFPAAHYLLSRPGRTACAHWGATAPQAGCKQQPLALTAQGLFGAPLTVNQRVWGGEGAGVGAGRAARRLALSASRLATFRSAAR